MNDIISKWVIYHKALAIAMTEDNKLFDIETKQPLVEHWNNGSISYRIPRTSDRIGLGTILRKRVEKSIVVSRFVPF